jgi:hypothetical protein
MMAPDIFSASAAIDKDLSSGACKAGDILIFKHGNLDIAHMVIAKYCDFSRQILLTAVGTTTISTCTIVK